MREQGSWRTIAALFIAFSMFWSIGCGGGKKDLMPDKYIHQVPGPADEGMQSLFHDSLASLTTSSFRIKGEMDMHMSMQEGDRLIPVDMHMSINEDVQQSEGSRGIAAEMEMSGQGPEPVRLRVFLIDNTLYYEQEGQWFRSDFVETFNPLGGTGQLMTDQSLALLLDSADSMTVLEAEGGQVVFDLSLGQGYTDKVLGQLGDTLDQNQRESLKMMLSSLSYRLFSTVDIERKVITHLVMEMKGDRFEFMPGYAMSMEVRGDFAFSDHGSDIRVELPPEAAGAQFVDISNMNPF